MKKVYLDTFQLVNKDRAISPILTTTRMYGDWLESVFDNSICNIELYIKSTKKDGTISLERHPGTKIGNFFDKSNINSEELQSWFIPYETEVMQRLAKLKLAELRDAIPISVNDPEGRKLLRVYTVPQIELYIRTKIDNNFKIDKYITVPKQVRISDTDLEKLIKPAINNQRKSLF